MLSILSIDDSKVVHSFLTSLLEAQVQKLWHAYDGEEGLKMLTTNACGNLDLILLDWEMPKLTGIETLKKIREANVKTPVIMLTSKNAPEEILSALSLGANEYVMKPFTKEILFEKIEAVLGTKLG